MVRTKDIPGFQQMTGPERILLAEEIWETLSREQSSIPVPESHVAEVKRRMEKHKANPGAMSTLEELQERLRPQG